MTDSYEQLQQQSEQALALGDAKTAAFQVDKIWRYPGLLTTEKRWRESLALFARIEAANANQTFPLAEALNRANATPEDIDALFKLGYEFIEHGNPAYGATVLARAYQLNPQDLRILPEWVAALELTRHYGEAVRLLQKAEATQQGHFLHNYLLAFNALMTGDLKTPRRLLAEIQNKAETDTEQYMVWRLTGMLTRAAAIEGITSLDATDQRGWHFVLTAGLLLQPATDAQRKSWHDDTPASLLVGIRSLQAVLKLWGLQPRHVVAMQDRNSAILAHATATVLQLPLLAWSSEENILNDAVIPLYNLTAFEPLKIHRPQQILWAHHANWTQEQPYAADVTTVFHQGAIPFWQSRLYANPDTFEMENREEDQRDIADIANDIVNASGSSTEAEAALEAFLGAVATVPDEHGAAALQTSGARLRQWAGSPALL